MKCIPESEAEQLCYFLMDLSPECWLVGKTSSVAICRQQGLFSSRMVSFLFVLPLLWSKVVWSPRAGSAGLCPSPVVRPALVTHHH